MGWSRSRRAHARRSSRSARRRRRAASASRASSACSALDFEQRAPQRELPALLLEILVRRLERLQLGRTAAGGAWRGGPCVGWVRVWVWVWGVFCRGRRCLPPPGAASPCAPTEVMHPPVLDCLAQLTPARRRPPPAPARINGSSDARTRACRRGSCSASRRLSAALCASISASDRGCAAARPRAAAASGGCVAACRDNVPSPSACTRSAPPRADAAFQCGRRQRPARAQAATAAAAAPRACRIRLGIERAYAHDSRPVRRG